MCVPVCGCVWLCVWCVLSAVNFFDNTTKEFSWLQQIVHGFYLRWLSTKKVLCTHTKTNYNYIFTGRIATVIQCTARLSLNKIQKNAFLFIVFCIFPLRFLLGVFSLSLVLPLLFFFSFFVAVFVCLCVLFKIYFWNIQCDITDICFVLFWKSLEFLDYSLGIFTYIQFWIV